MAGRWSVALLAVAVLAGCGSPLPRISPTLGTTPGFTPRPTASQVIQHPTGALDVLLRMSTGGGLPLAIGPTVTRPAEFTLYGDGKAIYLVGFEQPARLMQALLNEDQIADLIEFALTDGGLLEARAEYTEPGVFDAGTTRFDINAGGISKSVSVYALGFFGDGPDQEVRRSFDALGERLRGFGGEVDAGNALDLGKFAPLAYRVTLDQNFGPEYEAMAEWPWPDLEPIDFGLVNEIGTGERVLQARYGEAVMALGVWDGLIVTGPNGMLYQVKILPLLPDDPNGPIGLPV